MLAFAHPWLALLAPLPHRGVAPPARPCGSARRAARALLRSPRRLDGTGAAPERRRRAPRARPASARRSRSAGSSSLPALMRPQWIEPPLHRDLPTRDLLLLVDLSGSMDTKDFVDASGKTVDRLAAVKQVLGDFLSRRKGDRVGVVVFGDAPFALVPFTTDLELAPHAPRRDRRRHGRAAHGPRRRHRPRHRAVRPSSTVKAKTIIALTDGNDTASKVPAGGGRGRGEGQGHRHPHRRDRRSGGGRRGQARREGAEGGRRSDRRRLLPRPRPRRARATSTRASTRSRRATSTRSRFRPSATSTGCRSPRRLILSMLAQAARLLRRRRRLAPDAPPLAGAPPMIEALAAFHFERPLWLLPLLPAARALVARATSLRHAADTWRRVIDPELCCAISSSATDRPRARSRRRRLAPGVWILGSDRGRRARPGSASPRLSPTRSRRSSVVLKVTPSMTDRRSRADAARPCAPEALRPPGGAGRRRDRRSSPMPARRISSCRRRRTARAVAAMAKALSPRDHAEGGRRPRRGPRPGEPRARRQRAMAARSSSWPTAPPAKRVAAPSAEPPAPGDDPRDGAARIRMRAALADAARALRCRSRSRRRRPGDVATSPRRLDRVGRTARHRGRGPALEGGRLLADAASRSADPALVPARMGAAMRTRAVTLPGPLRPSSRRRPSSLLRRRLRVRLCAISS